MTALPDYRTPLTAAEYAALPEDLDGARYELAEGWLMMSPRPVPDHQDGIHLLHVQLEQQLPGHKVLQGVDIDLEPAPPDQPGTVRVPDLVVVDRAAHQRVRRERTLLRAREVLIAVEFLSPGSPRIDTVVKHHEYAEAGIGQYWIVDLHEGPSLTVCHLAGEFGYRDAAPERGVLVTDTPFPLRIDVRALLD
jgi:Uma2 family endonuclease